MEPIIDTIDTDGIFNVAIVFVTVSLIVFAAISAHLSVLTRRWGWRWFFRVLATLCLVMAGFRGYAVATNMDGFYMHPVFPVTGIISWSLVTVGAIALYLSVLRALARAQLNKEGQSLTDEIFNNVVSKLLDDKPVAASTIARYKRRHDDLVARSL